MLVFHLLLCTSSIPYSTSQTTEVADGVTKVKLGLITPPDGTLGYGRVAAATTMAVEQAKEDGYLEDIEVSFVWRNGNCNGKAALGVVVQLYTEDHVDGFIGLPCSVAAINAGKLVSHWDRPWLSFSSADPDLADKETYNTLVRLMSPFNHLAEAVVELFHHYEWRRVVIFSGFTEEGYCDFSARALETKLPSSNITVELWDKYPENPSPANIQYMLNKVVTLARIVILCGVDEFIRNFLLAAHRRGMCTGDYVFLTTNLLPSSTMDSILTYGDQRTREAYWPLLQMTLAFTTHPSAEGLMNEIPKRMAMPPWNYNDTLESGQIGSPFALFLFDSVYMYCMCIDDMVRSGISTRNGTALFNIAKTKNFTGASGFVRLDEHSDRIGDYAVWHLPANGEKYELLQRVYMTQPEKQRIEIQAQRYWGATGLKPPPDTPDCGFQQELCPEDTSERDMIIIIVCTIFGIIVIFVIIAFIFYRKKKFENDLSLMLWKISFVDIEFRKTGSRLSCRSTASTMSIGSGNQHTYSHSTIQLGYYRGATVAVKMLAKTGLMLTRQDHLEFKVMREINNEHLNPFLGACVDPHNACFVTKYCPKGSLQDIIHNDDIKLDLNFKNSFISDLINGMEYLHRSAINSHGRLKSSNCVIDGRWMLKVTDWGLPHFRNEPETEEAKCQALFWTAPELLRDLAAPAKGSQKGDVYSFAIILTELLYRNPPYHDEPMVPKDIIGRIRNGESVPFRPKIPSDQSIDINLRMLITSCWSEEPSHRPDFTSTKKRFSDINKGRRFNIMDNMLKMMENYANNLEELVANRTKQLEEEKKKTDTLLYRMLPSSVADDLKIGRSVHPKLYSEVTVYFSDIVSFTTMSSESSPMEVVDFLNDLWILFDSIIDKYDVYKVETIGDAYMVASGVPSAKAGCHHASEIANMALDIVHGVRSFKIRHRPSEQLRVRIGMHSGPVVAGVVGLTMPRYCLFGDTVNTASRMESTGEALRIHVSSKAFAALRSPRATTRYVITERGQIEVKGKGVQTTYWLEDREEDTKQTRPEYED